MSKEIYISSTPHETRLAIVEEEALAEMYYERENEYTLAGSIYNGRVTRVLPGMQSAFVDIGLERDAFLYITDFLEETADPEEFDTSAPRNGGTERQGERGGRGSRRGRDRQERQPHETPVQTNGHGIESPADQEQAADGTGTGLTGQDAEVGEGAPGADGSRRWRGRRGRRRGRSGAAGEPQRHDATSSHSEPQADSPPESFEETTAPEPVEQAGASEQRGGQERSRRDRDGKTGRAPRGFARGEAYGGRGQQTTGTGPIENAYGDIQGNAAEPIMLPGESLSKYRKPGDETVRSTSATPARAVAGTTPLAPPATLFEVPDGWDGGAVLPGETLSRRGSQQRAQAAVSPKATPADSERANAISAEQARQREQELPPGETEDEREVRTEAVSPSAEYEPHTASASFRVDPAPPREFRNAPTLEPPAEFADEFSTETGSAPEPTGQASDEPVAHEITSISATGQMIPEPVDLPADDVAVEGIPDHADESTSIHQTHAGIEGDAQLGSDTAGEPTAEDEDFATTTLHASSIEEIDDEEETLEGAADLGVMLREMSIDEITRDHSGEEFEEEPLEEIEEYESTRDFAAEPTGHNDVLGTGEPLANEDDEFPDAISEGEDEPRSADTIGDETARPHRERRGRRDRRDGRRGRGERDRQGPGNGHGHGRPRHSMQSTNLPVISDLLKPGQEILVQIAKEPIAKKGARITSHIALPGRFLVFMPTVNHTGVSRKIESDAERRRLKEILLSEKGEASGGFIVRTAAEGASEDELRSDLRFLLNLWSDIKARSESSKSPALIYHDLNLIERILRDQVTDNFSAIWVDTEAEYERVLRFLQRFQPSLIRRVKLYTKETPLFEQFGITDEINKALKSKVWLKSGGSIVINQTEALVAIDINTGKFVGKTARLEDTIVKTNLDAIPEIVRQIRLRDLGGIIIIDFIDMDERKNRNRVMAALEDELKRDRAPSKVLQFNDFGLVAITRKRVKQSLERTLSVPCSVCSGTGMVKSPITVCNDIYVELRKMHRHLDRGDIMLRVHPDVVKQLKSSGGKWLQEMEEMAGKTILVKSDPSLHPEQFDIQ